jgi:hypothetical protein
MDRKTAMPLLVRSQIGRMVVTISFGCDSREGTLFEPSALSPE